MFNNSSRTKCRQIASTSFFCSLLFRSLHLLLVLVSFMVFAQGGSAGVVLDNAGVVSLHELKFGDDGFSSTSASQMPSNFHF